MSRILVPAESQPDPAAAVKSQPDSQSPAIAFTVEHDRALATLKQHGWDTACNPEKQRILEDLVATGFARKDGDAYVYLSRWKGLDSLTLGIVGCLVAFCILLYLAASLSSPSSSVSQRDKPNQRPSQDDPALQPVLPDKAAIAKKELPKQRPWEGVFQAPPARSDRVPQSVAPPQTPQEVAKKAFASTVLLVLEDANGQPLSLGSGFFVRESEIATNFHVIKGSARGSAKLVGQKTRYNIEGVSAVDFERDLVLLNTSAAGIPALPIGDSEAMEVGDNVYAVGNPRGLEGTFSQGLVSSIRKSGSDRLLQITAPISPGSSGGPVLNGKGEVVGVSVATVKGGQNLNFAIPSRYLKSLLISAGPATPLAKVTRPSAARSILADFGSRSTEGVVGGNFAWQFPGTLGNQPYSFTLRNYLRQHVRNVYCLLVFRAEGGQMIEVDFVRFEGVVPSGLAKRVTKGDSLRGGLDDSVGRLTKWRESAVEFRVLDFELVE
jgi:S1-C subfamily serine protease